MVTRAPLARRGSRVVLAHAGILLAGLLLTQVVLFGPSLIGETILLPLDVLALPGHYHLPAAVRDRVIPHDAVLSDQVLAFELDRRFAAAEFRAGRVPLWRPGIFAGAPFAEWAKYSPFNLIHTAFPSPYTLAWIQVVKSLVAGVGAYLFFRRVLRVGQVPAVMGAWCYPVTGFFALWQGYTITFVTAWFPWVLVATDLTIRNPAGLGGPGLAVLTSLVLISGQPDIGAQVLLISAIYAIWCAIDAHGKDLFSVRARSAVGLLIGAWLLGIALATPYLLPLMDYSRTSARFADRAAGYEERPPGSWEALPQIVLPEMYGSTQHGSIRVVRGNLPESSAATYTGLVATLLVAPLAWCSRRHRSINVCWCVLTAFSLGWVLNAPGLVPLLRLPILNLMSHNRLVFAASFAILAMAVVGLEVVRVGAITRSWPFLLPAGLLAAVMAWGVYRSVMLPEPLATMLEESVRAGRYTLSVRSLADVDEVRRTFARAFALAAAWAGCGVVGWLLIALRVRLTSWGPVAIGVVMVAELLRFAYGLNPQSDPALYYPRIESLEALAHAPPGRALAVRTLPANLLESHGLRDVRGYDSVDPERVVELLKAVENPRLRSPGYARTQWYVPRLTFDASGEIGAPGILSMLNVRYLIFEGTPPASLRPMLQGDGYWVYANTRALPRAYVPGRVEPVLDGTRRLMLLARDDFDPGRVAYVERPIQLPDAIDGSAKIVEETPTRVVASAEMRTPGLLVLADLWDAGWRVHDDRAELPILRTNHALRGVQLTAGQHTLVFRYEPLSFVWGLRLMSAAAVGLLLWVFARSPWAADIQRRETEV